MNTYYTEIAEYINKQVERTLQESIISKGLEADGSIYKQITRIVDVNNQIDNYYVNYPDNPILICSVQLSYLMGEKLPDRKRITINF